MSLKHRWIGREGAAIERVGMAFAALGYVRPRPDVDGGEGAYALNIAKQYAGDMSDVRGSAEQF